MWPSLLWANTDETTGQGGSVGTDGTTRGRSGCSAGLLLTYINSLNPQKYSKSAAKREPSLPQANIDLPGGQGASKGTDWATRAVDGVQRGVAAKAQPWGRWS